jgi:glycosyltransferase involved in cell wall biosynthesis
VTPKLAAVLITRNEAARLERCLDSIAWADEIVIVDSESTDRTVAIARARGANVYSRPFDDFARQRNWALGKAQHDWVLQVDADEEVPAALRDEIQAVLRRGPDADAYTLPRLNIVFGKPLRHGGQWPDRLVRLFRRSRTHYAGEIHERVVVDGAVGALASPLTHYGTSTIDEYLGKLRRYTEIEARAMAQRGQRAGVVHLAVLPLASFVRGYVLRRGFLDGYVGFLVAALAAFYVFVKYARLRERQRGGGAPPAPPG